MTLHHWYKTDQGLFKRTGTRANTIDKPKGEVMTVWIVLRTVQDTSITFTVEVESVWPSAKPARDRAAEINGWVVEKEVYE